LFVCLSILVSPALGYLNYQQRIPNGNRVPHPCKPNELWEGVGHFQVTGGGTRNPFGQDFEEAGKTWTESLCRKDSDGDGKTNGQELGDPDCTWRPNDVPKVTSGLSHPGVCEPLDSPTCQQRPLSPGRYQNQEEWMADACKRDTFVCEGLGDSDLKNLTLQFPKTSVPPKETTYMCAVFDFPEPESDVHMIATSPLLDNRQVMHHAVLFGCTGDLSDTEVGVPFECGMSPHQHCTTILSVWTLGQTGECFHSNVGVRLGVNGYTKLALQFHWNNPETLSTYEDGSGMTLHYTPNRRVQDAAIWLVGSVEFDIPPRQTHVTVESTCSSPCTKTYLTEPIYITAAWNHMHYLGVGQTIEHYRNGTRLRYITNDVTYSYDSPKTAEYVTPIEVLPGDELKTTCHFNSMARSTTTTFGDSTQQEMCYGFLTYYPAQALTETECVSFRSFTYCDKSSLPNCDANKFWGEIGPFWQNVTTSCAYHTCYPECKAVILAERKRNPCLANEDFVKHYKGALKHTHEQTQFLVKFTSCDAEIYGDEIRRDFASTGAATTLTASLAIVVLCFMLR
ncbi:hypothetical protein BaRGS_00038485, partial [Batillaria attramentaria]